MSAVGSAYDRALAEARRSRRRDVLIGLASAILLIGFLLLAITTLHKEVGGKGIKGRITRMEFIPRPETQISIGSQGLHKREIAGTYRLYVTDDASGHAYVVEVDPLVYRRQRVGGTFYFVPPVPPDSRGP